MLFCRRGQFCFYTRTAMSVFYTLVTSIANRLTSGVRQCGTDGCRAARCHQTRRGLWSAPHAGYCACSLVSS